MKTEKPILTSTPMVQAILEGRKSQTRRICKPQPYPDLDERLDPIAKGILLDILRTVRYQKGMILWVRETFYAYGHWTLITTQLSNSVKKEYRFQDLTLPERREYLYEDCPFDFILKRWGLGYHKRPSIFMPKAASRIKLEITDVRVERVQDISDADAISEGLRSKEYTDGHQSFGKWYSSECGTWHPNPVDAYSNLWESINGKGSWEKNPWVWCISFKRVK